MQTKSVKAIAKFVVTVAIIAAVLLITLGMLILLFPEIFFTVLTYALGGICLISGIVIFSSFLFGLLRQNF